METTTTADTIAFLWRVVGWCELAMLATVASALVLGAVAVWAWWRKH